MTRPATKTTVISAHLKLASFAMIVFSLFGSQPTLVHAIALEPELVEKVHVQGYYVLLSDLVKNAGVKGSAPLFRSPDPGTTGKISIQRILTAAAKHGLKITKAPSFSMVTIERTSRAIDVSELEGLIRERLEERLPEYKDKGQLVIKLPEDLKQLHLDPQVQGELTLSSLDWSSRSGRFTARFALAGSTPVVLKGTANLMIEVAVAKTAISRGKIISHNDVELKFIKTGKRRSQHITIIEDMIGQSAKRQLRVGQPIGANDVEAPIIIHKNQLVTILLQLPGLVLRTEGKALSDATKGETVKVLNTQSKRIIHATASASGLVNVTLASTTGSGS